MVLWERLIARIEPHYPSSGRVGRPPIGLARMLRCYFLQQWYSLSDEGLEDALYDSLAMREFVGIDLSREHAPNATTLLKFRCRLEDSQLTQAIFKEINAHLGERGLLMREGTLVDATTIAAPPSTENKEKARDAEMHRTRKGEQWSPSANPRTCVASDSRPASALSPWRERHDELVRSQPRPVDPRPLEQATGTLGALGAWPARLL